MVVENGKRLDYLDIAKGIAIILVVLGHTNFGNNYLCNWIYSFHLPIFFIVSGMLLSYKENWKSKDMKSIVIGKAKQLLYPYCTFSVLIIIYGFLKVLLKKDTLYDFAVSIAQTILLYGTSTLWFLSALFMAEIIFIFIYKYCSNKLLYFLILFILSTLGTYLLKFEFWNEQFVMTILSGFINFIVRSMIAAIFVIIGYEFYKLNSFIGKHRKCAVIISVVLFICNIYIAQLNELVDLHYSRINNFALYYICSIFTSLSILIILEYVVKKNKVLEYYGRNSLIIMVTHCPFTKPILGLVKRVTKIDNPSFCINSIIVCVIVMAIETVFVEMINRKFKFFIKLK